MEGILVSRKCWETSVSLNLSARTLGGSTTILYAVRNSGLSEQRKKGGKEKIKKMERTKGGLGGR